MNHISMIIKLISYMVFSVIGLYGILGLYKIVTNFGEGTTALIAPTIFILILSAIGIISTFKDVK